MLTTIHEPLSEDMIKSFHYELKVGVFEDRANGYAIGEYKRRTNIVNNLNTIHSKDDAEKMGGLDATLGFEKNQKGNVETTNNIIVFFQAATKILHYCTAQISDTA